MQSCIDLLPFSYLKRLNIKEDSVHKILALWNQTYRKYHSLEHLYDLLQKVNSNQDLNQESKNILSCSALFHDAIYNPRQRDNVSQSAQLFQRYTKNSTHKDIPTITQIILDTDAHHASNGLSKIFCNYDTQILKEGFSSLLQWEHKIASEFQFMDYDKYIQLRVEFLSNYVHLNASLHTLIEYVKFRKQSIAVYPGSFAPFHSGHMNILNKSEKIFDKVIVAVGVNPDKSLQDKDISQRTEELVDLLVNREVIFYQGYLTDLVHSLPKKTAIVRGLRNGYDLEYEMNQLRFIEDMSQKDIQVCFIPCDREFSYISSTAIRNMSKFEGNREQKYLPKKVKI